MIQHLLDIILYYNRLGWVALNLRFMYRGTPIVRSLLVCIG